MKNFIRASNIKLLKSSTVRIGCVVLFVIASLGNLIFYGALKILTGDIIEKAGGYDTDMDAFRDINMLDAGAIALSLMQVLSLVIAIVVTVHIANEKRNGVYSFISARGYSKFHIYADKLYESTIMSFVMYLSYTAGAVLSGAFFWHGDMTGEMFLGFIIMFITVALLYIAAGYIFTAIAINIKSGGAAIAINIVIVVVFSALVTIVDKSLWEDKIVLRSWWLFSAIEQYAYLEMTIKEIFIVLANAMIYGLGAAFAGGKIYAKSEMK